MTGYTNLHFLESSTRDTQDKPIRPCAARFERWRMLGCGRKELVMGRVYNIAISGDICFCVG